MDPRLRAQLDAYNTELFKGIQNEFTLTGYDLEQSAAIAQYNAQLQEFSSRLGSERLNQAAAGSALDRSLAGLQESRQRADLITGALGSDYVREYGVPTGSTGAFSAGDLGGASAGLAGFVGRGPDEIGIRYPGTAVLDPSGLLAQYDEQFGVAGPIPDAYTPSPTVPEAPLLPTGPSLLGPRNPTGAGVQPPPTDASGVKQRPSLVGGVQEPSEPYVFGDLTIDYAERRVTLAGRPVQLTAIEYGLLFELSANAGRVLTYDRLLQWVWGLRSSGDSRRVRTAAKQLRRKLGDDANNPAYILNEPRVGYRIGKGETLG